MSIASRTEAPDRLVPLATPIPWHVAPVADVGERLRSGEHGLTAADAATRLREVGPNELAAAPEERWWTLALRQLRDPLIYILLAAAGVTLALGDFGDTIVIALVVVVNSGIGFVQERHALHEMRALARLSAPRAQVLRDGIARDVASRELGPGDVVLLASGARVPADLRLAIAHDLAVDESVLTGESTLVEKRVDALADPTLVIGDQVNMAFAGTIVARGRAHGLVVRTGTATELGRLVHDTRTVRQVATPLQVAFAQFGRRVGVVVLVLAGVVLAIGLARQMAPAEIFLTAVALAVSAIPEGLPVVLTVTLAVGVRRMAARHAIIRSLPAVETLGCTTVIGSDKTGTLTRNEMTVRRVWTAGAAFELTGVGYASEGAVMRDGVAVDAGTMPALARTLEIAALANESEVPASSGTGGVGDPTEIALHVAAAKGGLDARALRERHQELDLLPFESERRLMVSLRDVDGTARAHLKGAPEAVLARCDRMLVAGDAVPIDVADVMGAADHLAAEGLRVLALAYRPQDERLLGGEAGDGYVLAGLVGMEDPLRPEAIAAVRDARGAGIRVLMLTGDHAATARTIGRRLGLGDAVMTGQEMAVLPDGELDLALRECSVFARVAPEHKLRVVQRLEAHGEVVAVTGDGANDAPALRAAHLGIATGASGSDVAREAADMVLADDDFATITAAVEEGRIVFANIRKVTFFLLSTAAGEVLAILVTLVAGWPLPFTAAQLLWINLVTDSLQVFALAFEPGEPGLLSQPPRPHDEGVLKRRHFVRLAGIGLLLTAVTLGTFWWALDATGDMTVARSAALTQMVVLQFYHSFNCRSLDRSLFAISPFSNRFLFASTATVALAHIAALHVGVLQRVLGTAPLTIDQWSWILLAGSLVVIGGEMDKLLNRWTRHTLG